MFVAAALFALLAVLLATVPRRPVFLAGAALQLLVIVGYLVIAAERSPAFEAWGVSLKVLQVAVLAALVALAVRGTRAASAPAGRVRSA